MEAERLELVLTILNRDMLVVDRQKSGSVHRDYVVSGTMHRTLLLRGFALWNLINCMKNNSLACISLLRVSRRFDNAHASNLFPSTRQLFYSSTLPRSIGSGCPSVVDIVGAINGDSQFRIVS